MALLATIVLGYALYGHLPETILAWSEWVVGRWPLDRMAPLVFIAGAAAILAGALAAILVPLGLLLLGRILAFSVLPSFRAAMGVATKTPPWAGAMPGATLVNLVVHRNDRTTSFGLDSSLQRSVICKAREDTRHQLTSATLQPPLVSGSTSGDPEFLFEGEPGAKPRTRATAEQPNSERKATLAERTRRRLAPACIGATYRWLGDAERFNTARLACSELPLHFVSPC